MSETTANLSLPYILSAQAQKHVTHNEALRNLDAIVQLSVVSKQVTDPPPSPPDGERHIVGAGATGVWVSREGLVAAYQDGAWAYHTPRPGWRVWLEDEARLEVFDGAEWIDPEQPAPTGAYTRTQTREEQLELSGETVVTASQFLDRSIVLGVSVRVLENITGAASFDVGILGELNKFGGSLGTLVGDTNIGVVGPIGVYEPTPIHITANGSPFTGGKIALALHYIECGPPAA